MADYATVVEEDRRTITIRQLTDRDRDALMLFGESLPQHDWLYLEDDLRNPEVVTRLISVRNAENWRQFVAVTNSGVIAGYSSIHRLPGWSGHVGNIKLLVATAWRRSGIGTALAGVVTASARDLECRKLIVRMLAEQEPGQRIFGGLGFEREGVLRRHVRDRHGVTHDMVVMAWEAGG